MEETISKKFDDVLWDKVKREVADRNEGIVEELLEEVKHSLIECFPRVMRNAAVTDLNDHLDWTLLRKGYSSVFESLIVLTKYVVGKIGGLASQCHADKLNEEVAALVERVERMESDAPGAVCVVFRFIVQSIKDLRKDIAHWSAKFIQPQLASRAVQLEREFRDKLIECYGTQVLDGTKAFIAGLIPSTDVHVENDDDSKKNFRAKALLRRGVVELVKSQGKSTGADRWNDFPNLLFHFDKHCLGAFASHLQALSLRSLLVTMASVFLSKYRVTATQDELREIDSGANGVLTARDIPFWGSARVLKLKEEVVGCVNEILRRRVKYGPAMLSGADDAALRGVVDRSLDITGAEYTLAETRFVGCLFHLLDDSTPDVDAAFQRFKITPVLRDDFMRLKNEVGCVIDSAWEVHCDLIMELLDQTHQ